MIVVNAKAIVHRGIQAGMLYLHDTGEIKAEVYACVESLHVRLTFLGFEEDPNEPQTYWLKLKGE